MALDFYMYPGDKYGTQATDPEQTITAPPGNVSLGSYEVRGPNDDKNRQS